ncbi:MAG: hypothetical protein KDI16_11100 [Halioglobus sp.]|nr:hypothetical protein [Halioglobus sp.]
MRNFKTMTAGLMVVALTGIAGCATNGDLEALRADVQKAQDTASQAAADAASARRDAASAKATAEQANDTANATAEKLDRMFKKSMNK